MSTTPMSQTPHAVGSSLDWNAMIAARATAIDVSGIRRVFELGTKLKDPINLSIGQPDFPVPDAIKDATITLELANGKTVTLFDGWNASSGDASTEEGEIEVKFEGTRATES